MTWQILLQGLLPLVIFAVVDTFASARTAIISAIVFALLEMAWTYYSYGEVDSLSWIALAFVVGFGLVAMKLDNSKIFKFQPVILGLTFALLLGYFQIFDEPFIFKFMPMMKRMLPPEQFEQLQNPAMRSHLSNLCIIVILTFVLHAAAVAYAALRMTTAKWLLVRGVGFYVIAGFLILIYKIATA